jgi:hypothetical protein
MSVIILLNILTLTCVYSFKSAIIPYRAISPCLKKYRAAKRSIQCKTNYVFTSTQYILLWEQPTLTSSEQTITEISSGTHALIFASMCATIACSDSVTTIPAHTQSITFRGNLLNIPPGSQICKTLRSFIFFIVFILL